MSRLILIGMFFNSGCAAIMGHYYVDESHHYKGTPKYKVIIFCKKTKDTDDNIVYYSKLKDCKKIEAKKDKEEMKRQKKQKEKYAKIEKNKKEKLNKKFRDMERKRIKDIKEYVKDFPEYKRFEKSAIAKKVKIGMPLYLMQNSTGYCSQNKTQTRMGTHIQHVCGYGRYIYTDNGIVTTIQD